MKQIPKSVGAVALALLMGGMLAACGEPPPENNAPERIPPTVAYTVDESHVGAVDANATQFYAKNVERVASPLAGKTVYWLGSSVTKGQSSGDESMADFLAAKTGCISKKDAVSGTTIFCDGKSDNTGKNSYTSRLKNSKIFDKNEAVDAFICQISTNDAWGTRKANWGEISADDKLAQEDFDLATTLGGIEFIIAYVTDTWQCPIYFYSGANFVDAGTGSPRANGNPSGSDYGELVEKVHAIAEKWRAQNVQIEVIDLFNDGDFNAAVSDDYYKWATSDPIHPKRAGYLEWWMPYFERFLLVSLDLY